MITVEESTSPKKNGLCNISKLNEEEHPHYDAYDIKD